MKLDGARVWLLTVGEPLPLARGAGARLMRTGLLAKALVEAGAAVTWWTSRFDHISKRMWTEKEERWTGEGLEVRFLDGVPYTNNISSRRLINHIQLAMAFRRHQAKAPRPTAILASLPTIELAFEASRVARTCGCRFVVDVRDLWPDVFEMAFNPILRPWVRGLFGPYRLLVRRTLSRADAVVAISEAYLQWARNMGSGPEAASGHVIPLGYPQMTPIGLDASPFGEPEIESGTPVALFIGTFGLTYDLETVIEAARLVPRMRFLIVGTGQREIQLRSQAAGLRNVTFLGWRSGPEIAACLRAAHVGLAAYVEGAPQSLPNKVQEYLSSGLFVISSLRGEVETMLETHECGVTYAAGNVDSLVRCLVRFCERWPDNMGEYRRRGLELFAARFRAETTTHALVEVIRGA